MFSARAARRPGRRSGRRTTRRALSAPPRALSLNLFSRWNHLCLAFFAAAGDACACSLQLRALVSMRRRRERRHISLSYEETPPSGASAVAAAAADLAAATLSMESTVPSIPSSVAASRTPPAERADADALRSITRTQHRCRFIAWFALAIVLCVLLWRVYRG